MDEHKKYLADRLLSEEQPVSLLTMPVLHQLIQIRSRTGS